MAPPPKPWTAEKAKEKGFSSVTSFFKKNPKRGRPKKKGKGVGACPPRKTTMLLSPKSRHSDDRPHDDDDDVTSTDALKEDDMSMRKLYVEALLQ
jgi:hypothetical protein